MVGFVWSGLCLFLLLCMGLRLLSLLLIACGGFGLLFTGWFGLVVSLLAGVCAVFSLLDGPTGCDPAFVHRLLRRYLALWPAEVGRVYGLLEMVSEGCPGHGPIRLLSASAAEIGFSMES